MIKMEKELNPSKVTSITTIKFKKSDQIKTIQTPSELPKNQSILQCNILLKAK